MARAAYLDYNATTPLRPEARAALESALDQFGNPSSVHAFGRRTRRLVEAARAAVAELTGVAPAQVVFTGGATEANNAAIVGCGRSHVLVSAVEHASVLEAAAAQRIPVDRSGVVDLAALDRLLAGNTTPAVVSIMAVNNETGVIQPVAEAAAIARSHGALVHCDAVQAAGKLPLSLDDLGVDMLTLSSHKIGGPQGVGALVLRDGVVVEPLIRGGGQERRRRAGTENVAAVAGFGAAARAVMRDLDSYAALAALRDRIEAAVRAVCAEATVFGAGAPRVANTSCILMPGVAAETQLMGFDLAGVAVSAGAACSSGKVAASHVLLAMGADESDASCAVRVSMGWTSTRSEADRFVEIWTDLYQRAAARPQAAVAAG